MLYVYGVCACVLCVVCDMFTWCVLWCAVCMWSVMHVVCGMQYVWYVHVLCVVCVCCVYGVHVCVWMNQGKVGGDM